MKNPKKQLRYLALSALICCGLAAIDLQAQYLLTPLRLTDVGGQPYGINDNGTFTMDTFLGDVVLVKGDSVTPVTIPNGIVWDAKGLNSQGTLLGQAFTADFSGSFSFMRTKQGEVTTLAIPGMLSTTPFGINERGVVVGQAVGNDGLRHGFVWDSTGPKLYDAPGATTTGLRGINASGTAVGNYVLGGISRACILVGSNFAPLDIPDALSSSATGINDLGQIVGTYRSSANPALRRGFVYDRGVVTPVDFAFSDGDAPASFPPEPFDFGGGVSGTVTYFRTGSFTGITGINDRGDIIGSAQATYTPVVDCIDCGLTPADFGNEFVLDSFTGQRDGSRNVTVKSAGNQNLQRIRVPHGTSPMGTQGLIEGQNP